MSVPFTHKDLDGDELEVSGGLLGAVLAVQDGHTGEKIHVAVRAEHLPALIEALESILKETTP